MTDREALADAAILDAPSLILAVRQRDAWAIENFLASKNLDQMAALCVTLAAAFDPQRSWYDALDWLEVESSGDVDEAAQRLADCAAECYGHESRVTAPPKADTPDEAARRLIECVDESYDSGEVDWVIVERLCEGKRVVSTRAEKVEAYRWLAGHNYSLSAIAKRLHASSTTIHDLIEIAERTEAA